jgi:hypothetical protein
MVEHQSDQTASELSQVHVADPADRSFVGRGFWLTAGCVVERRITAHSMTRAVADEPPAKVVTSEQTRHRPAGLNQWRADSRTETSTTTEGVPHLDHREQHFFIPGPRNNLRLFLR